MTRAYKKIAVITSGGDAPGLNVCIRAIVRTALRHHIKVAGVQHGFEGLIGGRFIPLDVGSVGNIIQRGGTILQSSRSEAFKTLGGRSAAYRHLKRERIDAVVLIGGDGSFEGAKTFIKEYPIPFICIPKTIDNDISGTDLCIGYDTALNTAVEAIDRIRDTAQSHERIFVVEVMGRDSGYIAYGAGIAGGAESVLIPETRLDMANFKSILKKGWDRDKQSLIFVVAEGDESGGAYKVAELVRAHMPDHYVGVCVLGHTQRGGSPSAADRVLASRFGYTAVLALLEGKENVMVGIKRNELVLNPLKNITKQRLDVDDKLMDMLYTLGS